MGYDATTGAYNNNDNKVVATALMCQDMDMHMANQNEVNVALLTLGEEYFVKIADKYGLTKFTSSTDVRGYGAYSYSITTSSWCAPE